MPGSVDHWRTFWLVVALGLATVAAFVLFRFAGTFVLGVFLYYASRPIFDRLRKRTERPGVAAAGALFLLALPVVLLFWYTATIALDQLETVSNLDLERYRNGE
jgi:predicted PurR-regulated permease PerM